MACRLVKACAMTQENRDRGRLIFPLSGWIEGYILSVEAAGRSPSTVQYYRWGLKHFAWWADRNHLPSLDGLTPEALRMFLEYLQTTETRWGAEEWTDRRGGSGARKKLSPSSVAGYVRVLKAFCSWLIEEGELDDTPFRRVKTPKVPKQQVHPLTPEEVRALIDACKRHRGGQQLGPQWDLRDLALVLTLLDTGLRLGEVLGMTRNSVSPSGRLVVLGKGRKERAVQVGDKTRRALHRWEQARGDDHLDALWIGIHRRPLTREGIADIIEDRSRMAGIRHVHPHLLRHTFGPMFVRNGGDSFTLQQILGHTSLDMTRRYVMLADSDVADSHRRNSPMDRFKW
jgi:site-specific recombinase XerD